jgi:glycerol-3-phosphate O-acyltransferase
MRRVVGGRAASVVALAPRRVPVRFFKAIVFRCRGIPSAGEPTSFADVDDEESFFAALNSEVEAGVIPKQLVPLWTDFFQNYKKAILSSELPDHDIKLVAEVQASIADTVMNQMKNPFKFPSYHKGITEPYDYFEFGQKYVGSLIDFKKSYLGHRERFDKIKEQIDAGDNVIILANHQSEADPGIWAHMLMHTHPSLARDVVYVAGDRVVTDPLCTPFSMGRNLFCVHSRRYMDMDPDTKEEKAAMNRQTLRSMGSAIAQGGTIIWIAPAGGRDRPDEGGVYTPAQLDPGSVELMRALATKAEKRADRKSHLYPFAMFSAPLMPPPDKVVKDIGERRMVNFTGVGISVGEALDVDSIVAGIESKEEAAAALTKFVYEKVCSLYSELDAAIKDPTHAPDHFSQPWLCEPAALNASSSTDKETVEAGVNA